VFQSVGFEVRPFNYFAEETKTLDFESVIQAMELAPEQSIFILHSCAHNPTGCDPSWDQWMKITEVMKRRNLFPLFDSAYLGMNSGDYDKDAKVIRYFADELKMEIAICLSFAKNMGLYGLLATASQFTLTDCT
jgi:aspartate aminotransferase